MAKAQCTHDTCLRSSKNTKIFTDSSVPMALHTCLPWCTHEGKRHLCLCTRMPNTTSHPQRGGGGGLVARTMCRLQGLPAVIQHSPVGQSPPVPVVGLLTANDGLVTVLPSKKQKQGATLEHSPDNSSECFACEGGDHRFAPFRHFPQGWGMCHDREIQKPICTFGTR
jgi:hypothetical protein